ncbi:MAG: hypothetical protein M5R42_02955 [Rhodocyclaceae bacterium]|nr:hypothetical protein [Rhodocyclaceae bacterium]
MLAEPFCSPVWLRRWRLSSCLREAKEFEDDMLRQFAVLNDRVAIRVAPSNGTRNIVFNDPESRILIIHLPGNPRPDWLSKDLEPGFHTLDASEIDFEFSSMNRIQERARSLPNRPTPATKSPSTARCAP